ncbi:MAG TPA: hypothetical protein VMU67_11210 [Steroidobacteraceae bacterium]|nr:hypothetical protein [Steroidobacteraceae bacterium]
MSRPSARAAELERLIGRALGERPLERAPVSLEPRLLAALERRALRPWWQRGFAAWPAGPRALFLAGAVGGVALLWWALAHLSRAGVPGQALAHVNALLAIPRDAGQAFLAIGELGVRLLAAIPREWLYGGVLAGAALYAALFGLLALGYLALYATPVRMQRRGS